MFKKINRVSSWLFPNLMKSKTLFSQSFRVKYKKNTDLLKISVVIPKKIIKKRVHRNRLKRQIIHSIKNTINTNTNMYIVFWVTKGILENNDWCKEITEIAKKIDIKKDE